MKAMKLLGALADGSTVPSWHIERNCGRKPSLPALTSGTSIGGQVEARIRRAAPDVTLWQATVYSLIDTG